MTPALDSQLGLLGSPPDPVGRFTMREGPSGLIVGELAGAFLLSPVFYWFLRGFFHAQAFVLTLAGFGWIQGTPPAR